MRIVITRVQSASVTINESLYSEIGAGFLVLCGISDTDTEKEALYLAKKTAELRVFSDAQGKMNLSCRQVGGEIMVVSNFTLYADAKKGTRPSFIRAARPERAKALYEYFIALLKEYDYSVKTGVFGADMKINSVNDGPVTILMDTDTI